MIPIRQRLRAPRQRFFTFAAPVLITVLAGLTPSAVDAQTQSGRLLEWRADQAPRAGVGWGVERFGAVREAGVRMQAAGAAEGPAARATLTSADDKPPPAQLVFPVPFQAGHRYRVTVELSATSTTKADVMIRRAPAPYDPMAIRALTLGPAWQTVSFEGSWPNTSDKGAVRVVAKQPQSEILIRRTSVDDLGPLPLGTVPQAAFPSTLIGIHVNKLGAHNTWPQAGQGLIRLWDTGTTWNNLAPTKEAFDNFSSPGWKRLDAYVDYVERNQPSTVILMTLGTPPRWASDNPDATGCAYGPGTCGGPASMDEWRHYIHTLATRYKGRVRHWELWNEADYRFFYVSTQSLAELARVAKEELKKVDPLNLLVSPGLTASGGMYALQTFLKDGGGRYVDIIAYHWYYDGRPEKLAVSIQNVREIMIANGAGGKPLWNTEGAPLCQRTSNGVCEMSGLSADDQNSVAERAILTMWVNGVSAYSYYTVEGAGGRTLPLLNADLVTPSAAAERMSEFSKKINGAAAVKISDFGQGGHVVTLERDKKNFYVAWSESQEQPMKMPDTWMVSKYKPLGQPEVNVPGSRELSVGVNPIFIYSQD